jgi:hypothetical protein
VDPRFYESWFNVQHRILGRTLHPFCFNDALILSAADSLFMGEPTKVSRARLAKELEIAVLVCSTPAGQWYNPHKGWGYRFLVKAVNWRRRFSNLETLHKQFQAYLRDYNAGPKIWMDGGNSSTSLRAPWVLANVAYLLRCTTLTEERVWTMPIGQALWYSATTAEQTGTSSAEIMSADEEQALRELGIDGEEGNV